jgi:hypothetical protein
MRARGRLLSSGTYGTSGLGGAEEADEHFGLLVADDDDRQTIIGERCTMLAARASERRRSSA